MRQDTDMPRVLYVLCREDPHVYRGGGMTMAFFGNNLVAATVDDVVKTALIRISENLYHVPQDRRFYGLLLDTNKGLRIVGAS